MAGFQFRLESVLKVRESRRDLCRQVLAQVLADQQKLDDDQTRIEAERQEQLDELKTMSGAGRFDVDAVSARRYYASQLTGKILGIEHHRKLVSQQIALCRKALTRADQEVKVLEKLRDKQAAEYKNGQQKKENRELEEAWMASRARSFTL